MKIAIFGAGSLGTVLGAYLSKAGVDVDLITRNKEHVDAMNKNGAKVIGTVEMTVPVHALTPEQMTAKYDIIFLMTKQLDNQSVVTMLKEFLTKEGVICTMQNGMPELSVAEILGEERTIGCTVGWGATLHGNGVSELTSTEDGLNFSIGKMNGQIDDNLQKVKDVLEKMCPVSMEENFMGMRWAKLTINATFSGMSAVTGETFGEVTKRMESRKCCQEILKECIDVAIAAGIKISKVEGNDIVKLFYYKKNGWKKWLSFFIYPLAMRRHKRLKASMLQDLEKGRKCEVDAINGVVSQFGRKYGVETPWNDNICKVIHEIEDGKRTCGFENIKQFKKI